MHERTAQELLAAITDGDQPLPANEPSLCPVCGRAHNRRVSSKKVDVRFSPRGRTFVVCRTCMQPRLKRPRRTRYHPDQRLLPGFDVQ